MDLSVELSTRMYDVVNAVAHGHESLWLMAEAVHIIAEVDKLYSPVLQSSLDPEDDITLEEE